MSLPSDERVNPRDVARTVEMTGRFHDVVVAVSKLLHGGKPDPEDRAALRWAGELLQAAASKEVALAMPSADELAGTTNAVVVLRRAARPRNSEDPEQALLDLKKGIEAVLRGRRDEQSMSVLEPLRQLFAMVSRLALHSEVARQGQQSPAAHWLPSATTLPS